jgi:hypothetical protein
MNLYSTVLWRYSFLHILTPSLSWLIELWMILSIVQLTAAHLKGEPVSWVNIRPLDRKKLFFRVLLIYLSYSLILWVPWIIRSQILYLTHGYRFTNATWWTYSMVISVLISGILYLLFYFAPTGAVLDGRRLDAFSHSIQTIFNFFWPMVGRILWLHVILFALPIAVLVVLAIEKANISPGLVQSITIMRLIYWKLTVPLLIIFNTVFYWKIKTLPVVTPDLIECQRCGTRYPLEEDCPQCHWSW